MTHDELLTMERDTCIVQIIGKRPFKDKKYDLTIHPRYKYHSKGDKYWFDIDKYLAALEKGKAKTTKNSAAEVAPVRQEPKLSITTLDESGNESSVAI